MNLESVNKYWNSFKTKPLYSFFGLFVIVSVAVIASFLSGFGQEFGRQLAVDTKEVKASYRVKLTLGNTWGRQISDIEAQHFNVELVKIDTDNSANILLNTPEVGRYTWHTYDIDKEFSKAFQSKDYFYLFKILKIDSKSGYIEFELHKTKQNALQVAQVVRKFTGTINS
ncbi:hypothetical protein AN214_04302 [Pseudoalteromonas sp. P1-9]|uniref:hypothetical protein n=1 Tax=Pseudoalteromonas sp. P1-9 TaxID=1710354 RepID=UPI0006D5F43C|nr:hypothetical protein [Pseudoalteromonas sp. P1-9]KPV93656.1 hypothetical protein AN214_04302 [Pseudoalteromonas sp. P1-9]